MIPYAYQLKACSEAFQSSMETLQQQGVAYHDDLAFSAAQRAVRIFVPDIVAMTDQRVRLESELGIAIEEQTTRKFGGLVVSATLKMVNIMELRESVEEDGASVELVRHDLCAIFLPRYVDPDPVDLVFSSELVVPFGSIELLEPTQ